MTEKMTVVFTVETKVSSDLEEKFNQLDTKIHIPMALKGPGMLSVHRYKAVDDKDAKGKYLVTYELRDESAIKSYEASPERKAAHQ